MKAHVRSSAVAPRRGNLNSSNLGPEGPGYFRCAPLGRLVQATLNRCQAASLTSAKPDNRQSNETRSCLMLWTIAIILLVLWLIGWVGFHVLGAAIHILVILAIIFIVVALVKGM